MINSITFRVVARKHSKAGIVHLNAQCFVNQQRVLIPLKIELHQKMFDAAREMVKATHPDALSYNSKIANARSNAHAISTFSDVKGIFLTRDTFRQQLTESVSGGDFTSFWEKMSINRSQDTPIKKASITRSTFLQHKSSLAKLREYKNPISFRELDARFITGYRDWLLAKGNKRSTVSTALKNLKCYCNLAQDHGMLYADPFRGVKVERINGRIDYLEVQQLQEAVDLYDSHQLSESLQESLLVFLIQCFLSFRISDARRFTPAWIISERTIRFTPYKTRRFEKEVTYKYGDTADRLVKDFFRMTRGHKIKADQRINDDLKIIGAHLRLRISLTTHVGRHTFATTFLEMGGDPFVLQSIMGHARIDTTMAYVHVRDQLKNNQMQNFDKLFQ